MSIVCCVVPSSSKLPNKEISNEDLMKIKELLEKKRQAEEKKDDD